MSAKLPLDAPAGDPSPESRPAAPETAAPSDSDGPASDGTPPRPRRVIELAEAAARVRDGMTVGLGGFSHQNPPMAMVRELVRRGVRDLTLVAGPTAGIETDVLIDAGCVRRLAAAGVALEGVAGIAPAFRARAEAGELEVWECDECIWYVALKAAAWGVPWLLWPGGVGSSLPELNPDLVEIEEGGHRYLRVPAIRPDIVFVHAAEADAFGNVRVSREAYLGRSFAERALAEACAGPVIATVEQIVDSERVTAEPEGTLLFGAEVVAAPGGAHPGGVSGRYPPDLAALRSYVRLHRPALAARRVASVPLAPNAAQEPGRQATRAQAAPAASPPAAASRRPEAVRADEAETGAVHAEPGARLSSDAGLRDLVVCAVARFLRDGQVVAFGLHAELMLAAALVAQRTHAPGLRIRHGLRHERGMVHGTAAWTARPDDDSWSRIEYREAHDAILRVANPASPMRFCDVFFAGGLQIDAEGSTNLIGLRGDDGGMRLRGPGSIGTTSIATLAPDVVLFSDEHSPRRFVERVDYVSVPGWKRRAAVGLDGGPSLVVTPLALLDFDDGAMRLCSVHPGVTVDDVVRATGFALRVPDNVSTTPAPSAAKRAALAHLGLDRRGCRQADRVATGPGGGASSPPEGTARAGAPARMTGVKGATNDGVGA